MITTDNVEQLIQEYRGHNKVLLEAIKRANGEDLGYYFLRMNKLTFMKTDLEATDQVLYFTNEPTVMRNISSIKVEELISFVRQKKLEDLGI